MKLKIPRAEHNKKVKEFESPSGLTTSFDEDGLNLLQRKFVTEYLKDMNATRAYSAAGYKSTRADIKGCKLLKNPKVRVVIEKVLKKTMKRQEISAERVIEEIAKVAFMNIKDAYDEQGNLKPIHQLPDDIARALAGVEIEEVRDKLGNFIGTVKKARFHEKVRSLELLAKYFKLLTDRHEVESGQLVELITAMRQKYLTKNEKV